MRTLLLVVIVAVRTVMRLACSLLGCWLPLAIVAIIIFGIYRVTHG